MGNKQVNGETAKKSRMLAIAKTAREMYERGELSEERLQMIGIALLDKSVIVLSKHRPIFKGMEEYCAITYDCESEEDFNELREQEIE